uniref:Beta-defensin n=1 Tax=Myotis lucifugus TaxID=59463 RepID=G1Q0Y9_MYOLU
MKLVYVLIFAVFFLSQVTPGCGYRDMHGFCDSMISVCLRRKKYCILRMPGFCPGRSFCCIRVK